MRQSLNNIIKTLLTKKKILLRTFALSLPVMQLQFSLGAILGYFSAKAIAGKRTGESGKIKSIAFNIGNYRLHLHHWLLGLITLGLALYHNFLPFFQFSFGFLSGVIFQGIYSYSDWCKIWMRRKNLNGSD